MAVYWPSGASAHPDRLSPQHVMVLSVARAHVWLSPAVMVVYWPSGASVCPALFQVEGVLGGVCEGLGLGRRGRRDPQRRGRQRDGRGDSAHRAGGAGRSHTTDGILAPTMTSVRRGSAHGCGHHHPQAPCPVSSGGRRSGCGVGVMKRLAAVPGSEASTTEYREVTCDTSSLSTATGRGAAPGRLRPLRRRRPFCGPSSQNVRWFAIEVTQDDDFPLVDELNVIRV